ncbi:membrane protein, putative [Geobacter metallireducens GS-15]|uniref:Membrane protein, putative n=1 Tax=Geobacter metallireducens (strain ATCC 53774 / DSM 7210 / GS-15) TaxID=269799 RepID=Q39TE6_GEOMG|nr:MFS transporter [Geobacter metallireducens]ABB32478.1 membrane protein, putative [Geobacter metallireducens GS-15]
MAQQATRFYGWTLVGMFFGIYFLNATFPYVGASVINSYMAESIGITKSIVGLGFSLFVLSSALSGPLVAYCVNKKGIRFTLASGGLIVAFGALLMALTVSKGWQYVLTFGVVIGTGVGLGTVIPIQTGVTNWFVRRRALAMSIALSAAGFGSFIAAPLLNKIIAASNGNWKNGWLVVVATGLAAATIAAGGVRNTPASMGQFPDGVPPGKSSENTARNAQVRSSRIYQSSEFWPVREVLKTKIFWLIIIASFSFLAVFNTCVAHGVIHLRSLGHSPQFAALSAGLLLLCSVGGKLFAGILGDRIEPRFILSAAVFSTLLGAVALANATNTAVVYLYACCVGVGFGASFVAMPTILANYYGVKSFAPLMGVALPLTNGGSAIAPLLAGIVYDRFGSYVLALYGGATIALLGAILVLFAKPPVSNAVVTVESKLDDKIGADFS